VIVRSPCWLCLPTWRSDSALSPMVFCSPSRQMMGVQPQLSHDHFIVSPFNSSFICQLTTLCSVVQLLAVCKVTYRN
jgi:hypothetical protein